MHRMHYAQLTPKPHILVLTKDSPFFNHVSEGIREAQIKDPRCLVSFMYTIGADKLAIQETVEDAFNYKPDLIISVGVTLSQLCVNAARKRNLQTPIVFAGPGEPLQQGLVSTLGRRPEPITGVALTPIHYEDSAKILLTYKPSAKKILLPYFPTASGGLIGTAAPAVADYLRKHGRVVTELPLYALSEIPVKCKGFMNQVDTVMCLEGCYTSDAITNLIKLCDQYHVTLFAGDIQAVTDGAALGYGIFAHTIGSAALNIAYDILLNNKCPGDISVLFIHDLRKIMFNADAATRQGLAITPELKAIAER
ncbi:MAG: putative tryptophan/tyrosine transport system substrate-binding protein [Candidatus Dependentiae bacterium]|nr:putative tryptophan/tyrosine transport system substrate-binding protein [Candidatus Dependentiae bacterium]